MPRFQHLTTRLACAGLQHRTLSSLVQQENADVVKVETVADQLHCLGKKLIQAKDGGGSAGDLGSGRKLQGAACQLRPSTLLLGQHLTKIINHHLHADGQLGKHFDPLRDLNLCVHVAQSHGLDDVHQRPSLLFHQLSIFLK